MPVDAGSIGLTCVPMGASKGCMTEVLLLKMHRGCASRARSGCASTVSPLVNDCLAAAGVDPAIVTMDAPDSPPTEILVNSAHAAAGTSTHQDTTIDAPRWACWR